MFLDMLRYLTHYIKNLDLVMLPLGRTRLQQTDNIDKQIFTNYIFIQSIKFQNCLRKLQLHFTFIK